MVTMVLFVDWECSASSNILKRSDLGALEGFDKYGRAFSKKFPYLFCVACPMDGSHGIELGSRARLGTRPSGTWVVLRTPWPLPSHPGPQGAAFSESSSESVVSGASQGCYKPQNGLVLSNFRV